jgi:hypothetical protein
LRRASSSGVHLLLLFSGIELFALRFQPGLSRARFFIEKLFVSVRDPLLPARLRLTGWLCRTTWR